MRCTLLPAARAAEHDDNGLGVLAIGPRDRLLDHLKGHLLLVEQHEPFALLHLGRRDGEQLLRRLRTSLQQVLGRLPRLVGGRVRVQQPSQLSDQRRALIAGVEAAMLVEAVVAELPALCRGVVQVGDAMDTGR